LQLSRLFIDAAPVDAALEEQSRPAATPSEVGVTYTYYRGVRTKVRKPQLEPQPQRSVQEDEPTVSTSNQAIVAEAVAISSSKESTAGGGKTVSSASELTQCKIATTVEAKARYVPVNSEEGASSTRNESRFRIPRLSADTQEISVDELQDALKHSAAAAPTAPSCAAQAPARREKRVSLVPTIVASKQHYKSRAFNSTRSQPWRQRL
jgi:hypothetical protein